VNVLLMQIDKVRKPKPNLALHKIAMYHKIKGDNIFWDIAPACTIIDEVYISCIFSWHKHLCDQWEGRAHMGGSGYSLEKTLPVEIEQLHPHINWGFTTRGCIRKCSFCVVPKKEGKIRPVADLLDIWDGKTKDIVLLDNNILSAPEHFKVICKQAREHKLRIDFNQGLDHRLLTDEMADEISTIRHKEYRFAFDHPKYSQTVEKAIENLQSRGINRCSWYVLVNFDTTFQEDLWRLNFLRERNQNVYVQRYNKTGGQEYTAMARWGNQPHIFRGMTWEQFLNHPDNKRYEWIKDHA